MQLPEFLIRLQGGGRILRLLCSTGEPSEEQIKRATLKIGLPVTFPADSFVVDPVRTMVYVTAYNIQPTRKGWTIDQVIQTAWRWHEEQRPLVI